jgi:acetyl-CoA synthetase
MLAALKTGAVLVRTTTLLDLDDLQDRIERGNIRHVICTPDVVPKLSKLERSLTRIVVGRAEGWHSFDDAWSASRDFVRAGVTRATDPLLLYFTSGATSKPKLVLHTQQSHPVGHLSTMYWIGLRPDDVHPNI